MLDFPSSDISKRSTASEIFQITSERLKRYFKMLTRENKTLLKHPTAKLVIQINQKKHPRQLRTITVNATADKISFPE